MDGPNVNWKFFGMLDTEVDEKFDTSLFEIGCCSLHVVHGAFQTGHKVVGWNMNNVFRSFYKLLHDSPAEERIILKLLTVIFSRKSFVV